MRKTLVVIYWPGSARKLTIWPSFLGPVAMIIWGLSSSLRLSMSWACASLQATASQHPHRHIHHIMDSHGLCDCYSQPTLRVLHNSYSSRRRPTLRFFLIWYVGRRSAHLVIRGAWNVPSGCLWYDGWSCKLLVEYLRSMESCMICRIPTIYQTYL